MILAISLFRERVNFTKAVLNLLCVCVVWAKFIYNSECEAREVLHDIRGFSGVIKTAARMTH